VLADSIRIKLSTEMGRRKRNPLLLNYACVTQQEIQSAHWGTVKSHDLQHDHAAVKSFTDAAKHHLRNDRNIAVQNLIEYSDGCGCQYKSIKPFVDISEAKGHGCYFGSRHGKSRCDGEGAVLKTAASRAVASMDVMIRNATEIAAFCQDKYATSGNIHQLGHMARTVILVNNINRNENKSNPPKTVQGTRSFHQVMGIE
jgi:hypothetical protein